MLTSYQVLEAYLTVAAEKAYRTPTQESPISEAECEFS